MRRVAAIEGFGNAEDSFSLQRTQASASSYLVTIRPLTTQQRHCYPELVA